MDLLSILFGMIVMILLLLIAHIILSNTPTSSRISSDIANDIVNEVARCPDCLSTDLTLIDRYEGVPWLRGNDDGDFFSCKKCGRQFSDEEWQEARKTNVDLSGVQD